MFLTHRLQLAEVFCDEPDEFLNDPWHEWSPKATKMHDTGKTDRPILFPNTRYPSFGSSK